MSADYGKMFAGLDAAAAVGVAEEEPGRRRGFLRRLRDSLVTSSRALTEQLQAVAFDPDDEASWERLEEALILADCGVPATVEIIGRLEREAAAGRLSGGSDLEEAIARTVAEFMAAAEGRVDVSAKPSVILVVGVNGTGKTTSIGKISEHLRRAGKSVVIGAADTFRAAAGEQLETWAKRAGADFVGSTSGQDPAAVAYDAISAAEARGRDVVIVDTAGRLHTQVNLMEELAKVRRVISGRLAGAPHETLLVIDSTTGQNGLQQARLFSQSVPVSGVILTKLDGSARGGIAIAIAHELGLPIKLIGVGEQIDDLRPFVAEEFARALFAPREG